MMHSCSVAYSGVSCSRVAWIRCCCLVGFAFIVINTVVSWHRSRGLFEQETDAAKAYDQAAVECKGQQARTNYDLADYQDVLGMLQIVCLLSVDAINN